MISIFREASALLIVFRFTVIEAQASKIAASSTHCVIEHDLRSESTESDEQKRSSDEKVRGSMNCSHQDGRLRSKHSDQVAAQRMSMKLGRGFRKGSEAELIIRPKMRFPKQWFFFSLRFYDRLWNGRTSFNANTRIRQKDLQSIRFLRIAMPNLIIGF